MHIPGIIIPHTELFLRLFLATILGGCIGLEREKGNWFAGLRTHMLVCIGSTLIMIVSQYGFEEVIRKELVILDPSRVAAQVVSGIGFLGAGTILFWKNKIRGLTTAASLWTVSAIGLSIGAGLYLAAIITTFLIFIVLSFIKPLEAIFFNKQRAQEIKFSIKPKISLVNLDKILTTLHLRSNLINLDIQVDNDREFVHLSFDAHHNTNLLIIGDEIKKITGIEAVEVIEF